MGSLSKANHCTLSVQRGQRYGTKAKGRLRNSSQYENVYITQDYAKAIQMERKVLIKAMFLARKKGMNARVVDRNLVVNNNIYNVDNIPDNLKETSTLNSNSS